MARVNYKGFPTDSSGNKLSGIDIEVNFQSTGLPADVYAAETGGSPITQPFQTAADGSFEFWTEPEDYTILAGTGATQQTLPVTLSEPLSTENSDKLANIGATTSNVFVGPNALGSLTSGTNNSAFGTDALPAVTSGSNNSAFGAFTLVSNTTGTANLAIGTFALFSNTIGAANAAMGNSVLGANTTGSNNAGFGAGSLNANTTGSNNAGFGRNTLNLNTIGSNNAAGGFQALGAVTTGNDNTGFGAFAGSTLTTGSNVTCLGSSSQPSGPGVSNEVTLGNSSVTVLRAAVTTITAISDSRDKINKSPATRGIDIIRKLEPTEFTWDVRNEPDNPNNGLRRLGFIAQEALEAVGPYNDVIDLVDVRNEDRLEMRPGNLIPLLVQAMKEQDEEIRKLKELLNV